MTAPTLDRPIATIDPRFRARRIAVARDAGRRRLYRLLGLLAVTVVVLATIAALRSPLLDVDRVVVTGAARTTAGAVVDVAGVRRGDALVDVDTGSVARRVATLPWVREVRVERHWPGTVAVAVTEREPVAAVQAASGGFVLVDAAGRLLAAEAVAPDGLPTIEGAPERAGPGERLSGAAAPGLAVAAALPPSLARVTGTVAVDGGEVELRLVPFGTVRLGAPDDLAAKFLAAATVLDQVDPTGFGVLDVRVPTAPVLTRVPTGG